MHDLWIRSSIHPFIDFIHYYKKYKRYQHSPSLTPSSDIDMGASKHVLDVHHLHGCHVIFQTCSFHQYWIKTFYKKKTYPKQSTFMSSLFFSVGKTIDSKILLLICHVFVICVSVLKIMFIVCVLYVWQSFISFISIYVSRYIACTLCRR